MVAATEAARLCRYFRPYLSEADCNRLAATAAALDWSRKQPLPQRPQPAPAAAAEDSDRLRQQIAVLTAAAASCRWPRRHPT